MRFSQIKPISYLKVNAAVVLDRLAEKREPMLITQEAFIARYFSGFVPFACPADPSHFACESKKHPDRRED